MKKRTKKTKKGIVLISVIVFALILSILGFSVLSVANSEIALAQNNVEKTQAFYLAEAGLEIFAINLGNEEYENIEETEFGNGTFRVDYYTDEYPPYAIATGTVGDQQKRLKVNASFLAPPYECGIYAGGASGTPWTLLLRGTGNPVPKTGGEYGGKDTINGNIFVNGSVAMYQESSVHPPTGSNPYELEGDVDATGSIDLYDTASISGDVNEGASSLDSPDLLGMNYAENNTHNVGEIFAAETIGANGHLPAGHPLRDVFAKNPTDDRAAECASTTGNDYFFEPSTGFIEGNWKTAQTPLHAGTNRVYYIDGNLWVNSKSDTFGFNMDGKATIVVTGDVFICDNLKYADANSMLGIVALGKYDEDGDLISGGNIIFGDPTYGTMYICSSMMFAANNFLFNSKSLGSYPKEPESGFILTGNISALNEVSIERDWYTKSTWNGWSWVSTRKPCRYDHASSIWVDSVTGGALSSTERTTVKHYQIILNYDDRVRNREHQPKGLPKGVGFIFEGLTNWEELP